VIEALRGRPLHKTWIVAAGLLVAVEGQAAPEPPPVWGLGLSGGISLNLNLGVSPEDMRSGFMLTGARVFLELLELELGAGGRFNQSASHIDLVAGIKLRRRWGRVTLAGGPRVGATFMHLSPGDRWSYALLVNAGVGLRIQLVKGLELRVDPVSFTLYWNKASIVCWEPTLGFGYWF
jgi:hypothetical protein